MIVSAACLGYAAGFLSWLVLSVGVGCGRVTQDRSQHGDRGGVFDAFR